MAPVCEQVFDAYARSLASQLECPVDRNREVPVNELPKDGECVIVLDGPQDVPEYRHGLTIYPLEITVEGYVRADFNSVGPRRNALYARVLEATAADLSLGGLVQDLTEGRCERENYATGGGFALTLHTAYRTKTWEPNAQP